MSEALTIRHDVVSVALFRGDVLVMPYCASVGEIDHHLARSNPALRAERGRLLERLRELEATPIF